MTVALITGITGQDGSYLAERLIAEGVEVHGLVLAGELPAGSSEGGSAAQSPAITYHVGDLGDPASIAAVVAEVQPDEIYNLGGISSVAFSWEHPTLTGQVSGLGAVAIMEAALRLQTDSGSQVRVLQTSSAEIFGSPATTPQTEETAINPVNPYGAAKAYAHLSARVFRGQGLGVSTVILYNHESSRRPETFVTRKITAAVARIARHLAEGCVACESGAAADSSAGGPGAENQAQPIGDAGIWKPSNMRRPGTVNQAGPGCDEGILRLGNLEARRDWGWAPDYVEAMILANRAPVADDYIVATGASHSIAEFAAGAFARVGITDWQRYVVVDQDLVRPVDAALQVGDAAKARTQLGWQPTVTFADLVNRMVDHDVAALAN